MGKKRIRKPNEPELFTNEQLGLSPKEMEYNGTKMSVNKHGQYVRVHVITKTKESFVKKAREIWGDAYDYTESIYINGKKPITIYCRKHQHYFTVPMAQNHIIKPGEKRSPTGCDLCVEERLGYKPFRGKHRRRTPEEIRLEKEEIKARRERKAQDVEIRKREEAEKRKEKEELVKKWKAKNYNEARFIQRVHDMYGDDLDTNIVDYQGENKDVTLICKYHGIFDIKPYILLRGNKGSEPHGCWKCSGLDDPHNKTSMSTKEYYRRFQFIYRYKGLTFKRRYKVKPTTKITAICSKHGEITHNAQWWLDGKGCEYCNGKFWPQDWIKNAKAVHGDKYQYVGDAPQNGTDYIHYICKEHGMIEQRYDIHVRQGCECPYCKGYTSLPLEERRAKFMEDVYKKHGHHHFKIAEDEYVNNDTPITVTCLYHNHTYKTLPDNLLRGAGGCIYCSASEGEATIHGWLDNHGISHQWQYQLPNEDPTLPLQYVVADFYLSDYRGENIIIEYNGQQHYEEVNHFYDGRDRDFAVQQQRDQYLRDYCERNRIRLIEIPYTELFRIDELLTFELLKY